MMPNLEPKETSLLESYEQGEGVSDYNDKRLNELQLAGTETLANNQKITTNISRLDGEFLQVKAIVI
jgi:hypothetical protein